jgi:DNA-binding PucR family transcriptional regulator
MRRTDRGAQIIVKRREPNAVAYRINQIFELLDVDPQNGDDMLLLQLACRSRELA